MLQNLHTHSTFCDGKNTPREMVEEAIRRGFTSLGFSGHAPSQLHSGCEIKDFPGYASEIKALKEEYSDRLEIFLGLELDYYSVGLYPELEYDYKIGSVHMTKHQSGGFIVYDNSYETAIRCCTQYCGGDSMIYAKGYYETVADMPNVLDADIVGHFDLLTKFSELHPEFIDTDSGVYRGYALEALHAVREKMEFFEVNTGAIGRGYRTTPYPAPFILDEMKLLDCKLLISSDCHNKDFLDVGFEDTKKYLKAHGFDTVYYLTASGFAGERI